MILEILILCLLVFAFYLMLRWVVKGIPIHDLCDEEQELTEDEILFVYE